MKRRDSYRREYEVEETFVAKTDYTMRAWRGIMARCNAILDQAPSEDVSAVLATFYWTTKSNLLPDFIKIEHIPSQRIALGAVKTVEGLPTDKYRCGTRILGYHRVAERAESLGAATTDKAIREGQLGIFE